MEETEGLFTSFFKIKKVMRVAAERFENIVLGDWGG